MLSATMVPMGRYTDADWQRLGDAIVRRRSRLGLTQQQIADLAEMNVNSVRHIESGGSARVTNLVRYDRALGWAEGSCAEILSGGEPTEAPAARPIGLTDSEAEVIERIMRDDVLSVDQRLEVIELYRRHRATRRRTNG